MKFAWIDIRRTTDAILDAVVQEAVHARVSAIIADDEAVLSILPPTVKRVLALPPGRSPHDFEKSADVLLVPVASASDLDGLVTASTEISCEIAADIVVSDQAGLDLACLSSQRLMTTVLHFTDPTKIPLEIVIAAADKSPGELVTYGADLAEVEILVGVLEKGTDGVAFSPTEVGEVNKVTAALSDRPAKLELEELRVVSTAHSGLGDRVCVDTCSHFGTDEGILIGSFASGFILGCSETHPLPYMPTRPFRVNAGALHSYVLGLNNRTNYLSELHAGSEILGVRADGTTRRVVVGRAKLETRPLLTINAEAADGTIVSLTVQDDWHVRVLGPNAAVLNVTELKPGDLVLGYLLKDKRHVGWAVSEFCAET